MKKFLSITVGILLSFLSYSQMYHSSSYEVIDFKNVKTLRSDACNINFVVDTAGKALTMTNLENGKISLIILIQKSSFILSNSQFKTWGYIKVKATSPVKNVSFTEFSSGKLASVNMYTDSLAIIFYISEKYNL